MHGGAESAEAYDFKVHLKELQDLVSQYQDGDVHNTDDTALN